MGRKKRFSEESSDWLVGYLIKAGKATEEDLSSLRSGPGVDLAEVVVEKGLATDKEIAEALADRLHLKYVDLDDDFRLSRDEVKLVPERTARRFCLIPLRRNGDEAVTIVTSNPLNLEAVDVVRSMTQLDVHMAVGCKSRITEIVDKCYSDEAYLEDSLEDIAEDEKDTVTIIESSRMVDDEQLKVLANDPPVVRFVNLILMEAVRDGASDIHLEPGESNVRVRIRVDGQLRVVPPPPKSLHKAIVTRIKILSSMDIAERRLPQDGRFQFKMHGRMIDIRVSSLPEIHGEKIVMRILDRGGLKTDMRDIGFNDDTIARYQKTLRLPNGIILLTGPTGSGKTTTLYSALEYLRDPRRNIQTVEEPVEYQIEGINQMSVKPAIGLDFAQALRFILRQDPDTILIGEIRDLETAQIAMRASLTGHLVLSTLHTNDAPSAFWRLQDIGVPAYMIAATLRLVLAQRLIRKLCDNCREEYRPSDELLDLAVRIDSRAADWTFMRGQGCGKCGDSGYKGRTAIVEFLEVTIPVRERIVEMANDAALRQTAMDEGMEPLIMSGMQKVYEGLTSLEEVIGACPAEGFAKERREA